MTNKKAVRTVPAVEPQSETTEPTGKLSVSILSKLPSDVKLLMEFQQRSIPAIDIIDTVRTAYPGFDKPLLSKCRNYKQYGIGLRKDAVKLLAEHFAISPTESRKKPPRRKPKRVSCSLTEALYEALQRLISQTGQTTQQFLENLILRELAEQNEKGA